MCNKTFIREFEIDLILETLRLHQKYEGDVSCVVWDAAIVLAKYLEETTKHQKLCLEKKKIVELGAGVGCVGLTASCLGADVLLTDLPEVLPLLELNVKENEIVLNKYGGKIVTSVLTWGEKTDIPFKPDLILLADCIYYKESIDKLVHTLKTLTGPKTKILLSQEMRDSEVQKNCWNYFVEITAKDFKFNYVPLSEQNIIYRCPEIKLIELELRQLKQTL